MANAPFKITPPYYPIVYVRGFAATAGEREETFFDTYYGYAATAVEKRAAAPPKFLEPIVFEGQLIRFIKEYGYVDAANGGLRLALETTHNPRQNPTRSVWISRFYDPDVMAEKVRTIEEHARDLYRQIAVDIPEALEAVGGDLGGKRADYRVVFIAHSMGGLVCRCLLQNPEPVIAAFEKDFRAETKADPDVKVRFERYMASKKDVPGLVHRLVTLGSPHGGIELSAVPDFLEDLVANKNPLGAAIFKPRRMREYLALKAQNAKKADEWDAAPAVNTLGGQFPEGRCLCVVGSDHASYGVARKATGSYSDGLVRQDRAYISGAYRANVHRAHSGRRGIVNSFESYENVRRFLFGDYRARLELEKLEIGLAPPEEKDRAFYDFEFSLSVRGTGVMLHRRAEDPCENAHRYEYVDTGKKDAKGQRVGELRDGDGKPVTAVYLHTGFLDTTLSPNKDTARFLLAFRVVLHQIKDGFLFDHEYPARTVYSESLEVRLVPDKNDPKKKTVRYTWLSEADKDDAAQPDGDGVYRVKLRPANTLAGELCVRAEPWDDNHPTTQKPGDAAKWPAV